MIANRGEIAVRVIRACREMGISPVAVYSDADAHALHVRMADAAFQIGPAPAADSYLRMDRVLEAARLSGADGVHPGYGFLAENAEFAQACIDAGLIFVGPPPAAMRALGLKTEARKLMHAAGVPVVPGTLEALRALADVRRAADEVGFPVALKAVAGGGGKGLRMVSEPAHLESAFRQATSEAGAAFGNPAVYLERAIQRPRHVEVQILADEHGQCVWLGERDCSIQRRHQKVLEESPSPAVSPAVRQQMGEVAVRAALAAGYTNAGTVEFLLARDGAFYFLEVNARLQVEHPVTEAVTGIDLVREQLRIASGDPLGYDQSAIDPRGYALECRIYAEDPSAGFLPSTGRLIGFRPPAGPGVRVDSGVEEGATIGVYYDPMIAKLIVHAADRQLGLDRMARALREFLILGVQTSIPLHHWLMAHPQVRSGDVDTGWLEREWSPAQADTLLGQDAVETAAIAAALLTDAGRGSAAVSPSPGSGVSTWRMAGRQAARG
ncbi:MAG: acetyl-CoA carboxylase biotin carboxylase subunit, partial [Chloroflexota bacterium]|nr:acetyl-CoA carboxylase biotin carboxylase subunit [Chloroflexota bacterium]